MQAHSLGAPANRPFRSDLRGRPDSARHARDPPSAGAHRNGGSDLLRILSISAMRIRETKAPLAVIFSGSSRICGKALAMTVAGSTKDENNHQLAKTDGLDTEMKKINRMHRMHRMDRMESGRTQHSSPVHGRAQPECTLARLAAVPSHERARLHRAPREASGLECLEQANKCQQIHPVHPVYPVKNTSSECSQLPETGMYSKPSGKSVKNQRKAGDGSDER